MNRLMDKKAKTVFLITLCSAMLIVHAFARFGTSFLKRRCQEHRMNWRRWRSLVFVKQRKSMQV